MKIAYRKWLGALFALAATTLAAQTDEAALASLAAAHEASAPAPLLDRDAFLQAAAVRTALLAPDGKHVAWLAGAGLERNLHLLDTATLQSTRLFGSARLRDIMWGADGKLVLDLGDAIGLIDPAAPTPALIARLDPVRGDYLLGSSRAAAGGVLVVRKPAPGSYVLELVADTGVTTELFSTEEKINAAFLAPDGVTVFMETVAARERHVSAVRSGVPQTLLTCSIVTTCRLVAHDIDADTLWLLTSHDSDLISLQALSLADGMLRRVHADPHNVVDLDALTTSGSRPAIARYRDGTVQNYALEPAHAEHLALLEARFSPHSLAVSISADGSTWLVVVSGATLRESRHYLYTTASMEVREVLDEARSDALLPPAHLSDKIPLRYQARDGQTVHGYVSLPKGLPLRATPLVAVPHGGPWGHVISDYVGLTQFLVNRGYIVFEPNFRASTGYGRAWMEAGRGEMGDGAVQHDIVDGVQYLLSQGIGDPGRLGIVGMSFGGFSVLAGLTFTPELFKVGIAGVPPAAMGSSLRHMIDTGELERDPELKEQLRVLMADVDNPAEMQQLYERSPQPHLGRIVAPLLIMAGADDTRVSIAHVKDYALELANLGKTLSLFIDEDEGHGLDAPQTRRAVLYMTEKMLELYLGGRSQPLDDAVLASYMQRKLLLNTNTDFTIPSPTSQ